MRLKLGFHKGVLIFTWILLAAVAVGCAATAPASPPPSPTAVAPTSAAATQTTTSPTPASRATSSAGKASSDFALAANQASPLPGVPAGVTKEGDPYLGDPNAPVLIEEFSDFQCPFCRRYVEQTQPSLDKDYVATGKVRLVFKNFPLRAIHPHAESAAEAALCAGVQGKFWPMHDLLFQHQSEWEGKKDAAPVFRSFAQKLGLDMARYDLCWKAQPFKDQINRELAEGKSRGVSGTPSFFINGWPVVGAQPLSTFRDVIAKASKGEHPTPTPTPTYGELHPFDVNPKTPGRTYMGDAYIGRPDAPVLILEVSDLLCPYCRRHHTEVWSKFKAAYIDTGKVRVVFKHLLGHGEKSLIAGEATECAGNQGKFFEYAGLLYRDAYQGSTAWTTKDGSDLTDALKAYAQKLGLDMKQFDACLDNHKMAAKVQADNRMMIQANVRGTPTFIIIVHDKALGRVPGFLTWNQWQQVMTKVFQSAGIQDSSSSGKTSGNP